MRVIWTEPALDDIARVFEYLDTFNPRAARHVADGLLAKADSLEHFPRRGRRAAGTDMRELLAPHNYAIRYRIVGDSVLILRVRHTSRRPTTP